MYEGNNFSRQLRYHCPPQQSAPELINEQKNNQTATFSCLLATSHAGLSLRATGWEFPTATMSMTPVYFHR